VAAYLADSPASSETRESTLAAVGKLVADLANTGDAAAAAPFARVD